MHVPRSAAPGEETSSASSRTPATSIYEVPRSYRRVMIALAAVSFAIPALAAYAHAQGLLSAVQSRRTLALLGWGIGALILLVAMRGRLVLAQERLVYRGLWRTRSVARDDLVGVRFDSKTFSYVFHVTEGSGPPLSVPSYLDFDERFDEFVATLDQLGDRSGISPREARSYMRARRRAILPLMAATVGLFFPLALSLVDLFEIYAPLFPWLGVWIMARHPRFFRLGAGPHPGFLAVCALTFLASMLLAVATDLGSAHFNGQIVVLPSLVLWAVAAFVSWRAEGSWRGLSLLGLTLAWSGYAFVVPVLLNRKLDWSEPTIVSAVLDFPKPAPPSALKDLRSMIFLPPGPDAKLVILRTDYEEFSSIRSANRVCVRRHAGTFGIEWWDACDDRALAALARAECKKRCP